MQDLLADEENQSRRTFCQMPFSAIYENAEKGQTSVANLLAFIKKKNTAERKCADAMLTYLGEVGELGEFEEPGTSVKGVLNQWHTYLNTLNTQQLTWTQVVDEHVARPLVSLKEASSSYIQTLQAELARVNDEYTAAEAQQRKEIGVPSFELQRLAYRVKTAELEVNRSVAEKAQAKTHLLQTIVSRDEMSMAVSVAYQRAEEERRDQLGACMKLWLSVEKEHIKFREKQLQQLEAHVVRMDRAGDVQLLIHNHRHPDNLHFQGKALSLLDWQWTNQEEMTPLLHTLPGSRTWTPPPPTTTTTAHLPHEPDVPHDLAALLSSHFDDQSEVLDDQHDPPAAVADCTSAEARQLFVQTLNRQRSLGTKVACPLKFRRLVQCFLAFFDACVLHDDTKAAKTAMMLSATFYMIPPDHHVADDIVAADQRHIRRYVQEDVKGHVIWSNPKFGQLGSFTLSMLEMDVPITQIRYFIETMCDAHELTEEQRFLLRANLREIAIKLGYTPDTNSS
ncbi:hypothetical protein DYB34_001457 [Aphanomyces astaci]|uniref:SBF1/SBF2 domain-containing protein n=1 Tax=Aphanomyces astaci TaxID=112090 RepID=A0A3R6ZWR3_APHAT|nr:hypothetical protein DYB34_001457 [Aphanomyces astaci]